MNAARLERFLHEQIPLSAAMQIRVAELCDDRICITAPLNPNRNDKGTGFGGSLASIATLAGWGLMHSALIRRGTPGDVVIHKSTFSYDVPVDADIVARCRLTDWDRFCATLDRRSRARISLTSTIGSADNAAVTMEGRYVAKIL